MGPVRSPSVWPASTPGSSRPPPRAGGPDKEIRMITHRLFARVMPAVLLLVTLGLPTSGVGQGKSTPAAVKERGALRIGAAQAAPWFFKHPATQHRSGFGISPRQALAH